MAPFLEFIVSTVSVRHHMDCSELLCVDIFGNALTSGVETIDYIFKNLVLYEFEYLTRNSEV